AGDEIAELRRFDEEILGYGNPGPFPFVRAEEEDFVPLNRAAERAAKLVHAEGRAVGLEELAAVKLVITEVFVGIAMELVRAVLGHHLRNGPNRAAVLRRKGLCVHTEFLDRVKRGLCVAAAAQALI